MILKGLGSRSIEVSTSLSAYVSVFVNRRSLMHVLNLD